MVIMLRLGVLLAVVLSLSGCSDMWCWPFECSSSKSSSGVADTSTTTTTSTSDTTATSTSDTTATSTSDTTTTTSTDSSPSEFDLSKVTWLHTDVSSWPVTSTLTVSISNGTMCLNFSGTSTWPTAQILHTNGTHNINVNANPWVFVSVGGKWYGGTWEWMTPNGNCKPLSKIEGGHIKRAPLTDWNPKTGDTLYFMVSSLARGANLNNYHGRTNVVKVTWP